MSTVPLEIDVRSVQALRNEAADFLLLDCREMDEWQAARIDGAKLIPMRKIPNSLAELEAYRTKSIVVHCHHGGRSLQVTHWLRNQGFALAQNMTGGIDAWSLHIDPRVPRYS